jgi:hypothetical protein
MASGIQVATFETAAARGRNRRETVKVLRSARRTSCSRRLAPVGRQCADSRRATAVMSSARPRWPAASRIAGGTSEK